jgi:hypothetical protein
MGSILDDVSGPAKVLLIGKTGSGKTGSLASLVAAGWNLRIIDTDKGIRPLRSLLTDPRYPYARYIAQQGIDLNHAVRYVSIDTAMKLRTITIKLPGDGNRTKSETLLAPTDAKAWPAVVTMLDGWKEGGIDLGSIYTWGSKDVLVLDSFSTLAKCAYYFSQSMNNRLGARDSGYDYQRDIGEAQSQLTRLLEMLTAGIVPCNIIVISHITWVEENAGVARRPNVEGAGELAAMASDGYPSAIGRALSPQMGKYFNDSFTVKADGTGESVRRVITTVPTGGVIAKNSVFLNREYNVASGLAEIFSAITSTPLPPAFMETIAPAARRAAPTAPGVAKPSDQRSPAAASA